MRRIVLTEGEHKRLVACLNERLEDAAELRARYNLGPMSAGLQALAVLKDKLAAAPREEP